MYSPSAAIHWAMAIRSQDAVERTRQRTMWQPLVTLENWAVVDSVVSDSYRELRPGKHLTGTVVGPANLPNTNFIFTSPVVSVDIDKGVVQTRNTIYQLG